MRKTPCVIPDRGVGPIRRIPVSRPNVAALLHLLDGAAARTADFTVALSRVPGQDGFLVVFRHARLGFFGGPAARDYDALTTLLRSGHTVMATARAEKLGADAAHLELRLPQPDACLPSNPPPEGPWALLPDGAVRSVNAKRETLVAQLGDARHLVLTLAFDDAGDVVVASAGGAALGTLDDADAAQFAPLLRRLENRAVAAVVRGYHDPDTGTLSVCAHPRASAELVTDTGTGTGADTGSRAECAVFRADSDARAAALRAERDDIPETTHGHRTCLAVAGAVAAALVLSSIGAAALTGRTVGTDAKDEAVIDVLRKNQEQAATALLPGEQAGHGAR